MQGRTPHQMNINNYIKSLLEINQSYQNKPLWAHFIQNPVKLNGLSELNWKDFVGLDIRFLCTHVTTHFPHFILLMVDNWTLLYSRFLTLLCS